MAKSALNRHHWYRVRNNRKRYNEWFYYREPRVYAARPAERREARRLNRNVKTPCLCSCSGCANNRHKLGYKAAHDIRWDHKTGFELRYKPRITLDDYYNENL